MMFSIDPIACHRCSASVSRSTNVTQNGMIVRRAAREDELGGFEVDPVFRLVGFVLRLIPLKSKHL